VFTSGDYLRFLAANGYTLAPVEEVITGTRTAANTYDTYLRDQENPAPDEQ
jgi:ParB family chromosome partitioning protein